MSMRPRSTQGNGTYSRSISSTVVSLALACGAGSAFAQSSTEDSDGFYVRGQLTHDDNLFRLPDDPSALGDQELSIVSAEDYISRAALGFDEAFEVGRQTFRVNLRAEDVRFDRNEHLDHTAGRGRLAWEWLLFGPWSGTIEAEYRRALADFGNVRSLGGSELAKDMLETMDYSGELRYKLGPRWALYGGVRRTETEHSAELRRFDDIEANIGKVGVEYATPSEHSLAFEYRRTEAEFPNLASLGDIQRRREYEQNTTLGRLTYVATVRTRFNVEVGYTERRHPDDSIGEFSGNTWRAEIDWEPRVKFGTTLAAWREIKAYTDAESDYFVTEGFGIEPWWSPVRSLTLSMAISWEDLEFLGSNPLLEEEANRADEVAALEAKLVYTPRPRLRLDLSWRGIERDSNRARSQYDANAAMAAIQWRFL